MRPSTEADRHEHAEEMLEDYLLGTLPAGDKAWMDSHLQACPRCQEEIEPLLRAVQALPFAAPEPDVTLNDAVWLRIERSISNANSPVPLAFDKHRREKQRSARLNPQQWLMVAALMLVSLIGGVLLAQALPRIGDQNVQMQHIAIQFTDPDITANGELRYLPGQEVFVLSIENMPPPPEGQVYQAWLIDSNGPVSAGVMNTGLGELAAAGDRSQFSTFAITIEPGPIGNEAPTTEPIMVAPLSENETS